MHRLVTPGSSGDGTAAWSPPRPGPVDRPLAELAARVGRNSTHIQMSW
jgi:hypothetical protein